MLRVVSPPFCLRLILLFTIASGLRAASDLAAAWELVARHLPGDALAQLGKAGANQSREEKFVRAVALMDSQPVTEARLQQVAEQLAGLARGDDEIATAAAYLLGRLHQVHFPTPDPARAAQEFEQLAARHPHSPWAQLGLVKLAVLRLYVLPEPATPAERLAAAEALLPQLTVPGLRRDLHIVLGRARLFHGRPVPEALEHFVAADRIGGLSGVPHAELQLQIAELSRREGNWTQAHSYFQRFLEENEVDARAYQVKLKLVEIAPHLRTGEAARP